MPLVDFSGKQSGTDVIETHIPGNNMTTTTQAQRAYTAHQARIKALLASISTALDDHAVKAAGRPNDWGFAGDLGHIEQQLRDLASGMGA